MAFDLVSHISFPDNLVRICFFSHVAQNRRQPTLDVFPLIETHLLCDPRIKRDAQGNIHNSKLFF